MSTKTGAWFVYLIECRNGSIYTGIAVDVAARFAAHLSGRGARYTRMHPPTKLLASVECPDRSSALKTELRIKKLSAIAKRDLAKKLEAVSQTTPAAAAPDSRA